MQLRIILAAALFALMIGSFIMLQRFRAQASTNTVELKSQSVAPQQQSMSHRSHDDPLIESKKQSGIYLESGYRWDPANPGVAANEEDAAWLGAHGYPGPDVERYLMSLSLNALQRMAREGNQSAAAILAYKKIRAGEDGDEAIKSLDRIAAGGSVYALKVAADIFQGVPEYRNPELAYAYYGLMLRRGDHSGLTARAMYEGSLSSDQMARSRIIEEMLWRNLVDKGGVRLDSSIRPGFGALLTTE